MHVSLAGSCPETAILAVSGLTIRKTRFPECSKINNFGCRFCRHIRVPELVPDLSGQALASKSNPRRPEHSRFTCLIRNCKVELDGFFVLVDIGDDG